MFWPRISASDGMGRVHTGGGLVQAQDPRVLQERPGQAEQLPLPAGEILSARAGRAEHRGVGKRSRCQVWWSGVLSCGRVHAPKPFLPQLPTVGAPLCLCLFPGQQAECILREAGVHAKRAMSVSFCRLRLCPRQQNLTAWDNTAGVEHELNSSQFNSIRLFF